MKAMGTEFKVGLFTLLGIVAIAFAVFFVSPELFDHKEKKMIKTSLRDASGLLINTHVKTNGVNIGRVSAIKLSENATAIEMEVEADVIIPEGSEIAVRTVGFLGDRFIDVVRPLEGGGKPVENNAFIPPAKSSGDISEVVGKVGAIADDIKKVTENLAKVLGDKKGEVRMESIAENMDRLMENARLMLDENRKGVREMVANFREVSVALRDVTNIENREKIDRILTNLDSTMNDFKVTSENAKLITQRIEKGEGTIGKLVNDDKTANDIQATLRDLREVLSPVTKLQVAVETHGEFRKDETNQTYFNLRLNTRPDSYYLVGFTTYPDRIRDTETETLATGGNPTIRERIRDDKALRFNIQFAKRWGWIGARLGLFESTGGAALDLYAFRDRLKLSLEGFDFSDKRDTIRRNGHLKAYASVLFFDHLIAMVGIDDPLKFDEGTRNVRRNLNPFIGAGLTFNDQDLKTLFGAAGVAATGAGSGL